MHSQRLTAGNREEGGERYHAPQTRNPPQVFFDTVADACGALAPARARAAAHGREPGGGRGAVRRPSTQNLKSQLPHKSVNFLVIVKSKTGARGGGARPRILSQRLTAGNREEGGERYHAPQDPNRFGCRVFETRNETLPTEQLSRCKAACACIVQLLSSEEGATYKVFFFFTLVTGPRRSLSLKLSDTRV